MVSSTIPKPRIAGKGYVMNAEVGFPQVEALFPLYDDGRINHIEVTTIAVHNGKRLDYMALAELFGGREASIEIGDTFNDAKRLIDLTNPANSDMVDVIFRDVTPAFAKHHNLKWLNGHEVAGAQFVRPGQIPLSDWLPYPNAVKLIEGIWGGFQEELKARGSPANVRYENVHGCSTQRSWDDCIKFAPIGNIPRLDSAIPYTLDIDHFMMEMFFIEWVKQEQLKGTNIPVGQLKNFWWWVPARGVDGMYPFRVGVHEKYAYTRWMKPTPTESVLAVMQDLIEEGKLAAIHLTNLPAPNYESGASKDERFAFHDAGGTLEGCIDLKQVAKLAIQNGILMVCEIKEPIDLETGYNGYLEDRPNLHKELEIIEAARRELESEALDEHFSGGLPVVDLDAKRL